MSTPNPMTVFHCAVQRAAINPPASLASGKLRQVWRESTTDRTRIVSYLAHRGLTRDCLGGVPDDVIRFHPALPYWGTGKDGNPALLGDFPAMVAKVTDISGKGVTLHRTYLDPSGPDKLNLGDDCPARKLMTPDTDGATNGASIKLETAKSTLGLAEGIETALAVTAATGQHCWSCVSAHGLESVIVPDDVRTVHVWADNDASGVGRRAAERLAERLSGENRCVYVHIPPLVGADWLDIFAASGPDRVLDSLGADDEWRPGPRVGVLLSEVKPERVSWLWPGRLPLGKLTVLDGDPGKGKSTLSLDLSARSTRGDRMPDGSGGGPPAGVVILSGEDGLADTIVPRLIAAGADLSRVVALASCRDSEGDGEHPPVLPDDLPTIRAAIARVGAKLVIIDPLMAYLSDGTNSHKDQDIRRVLFRVAALAEETGAAFLVVRHLNKAAGGVALYRGGGSIGIIGAARSGLLVAADPDDENRRVLASTKCNLCPPPESLSFHLEADEGGAARVVWDGTSAHGANALLAMPATEEDRHAIDEAKDFLLEALAESPVNVKQVQGEAARVGISEATLRRAKTTLGIVSEKLGMGGPWVWTLPKVLKDARTCSLSGVNTFAENEHLREAELEPEHGEVVSL